MSRDVVEQVQRYPPFGPLGPRRVLTLPLEQIHPVVRIAHRLPQPINIRERILFDHELVLILDGTGELVFRNERLAYGPHDLLFIPPFVPHGFQSPWESEGDHVAVHFDFAVFSDVSPLEQRRPYEVRLAHGLHLPRRLSLPRGHRLEQTLIRLTEERLAQERPHPDPLSALRVTSDMLTVLTLALTTGREHALPPPPSARNQARIRRVLAFIHANLTRLLSAEVLAGAAGLSLSRLNTLFRQETGYSPQEYVRRARIAAARRLLADPTLSIKEIAARVGFEDTFQFSKVFRRVDGLSPTHYRDALLASLTQHQPIGENANR